MTNTITPTDNQAEIWAKLTKREALKGSITGLRLHFSITSEQPDGSEREYRFRDSGSTLYAKSVDYDPQGIASDEINLGIIHLYPDPVVGQAQISPDFSMSLAIAYVMNAEV